MVRHCYEQSKGKLLTGFWEEHGLQFLIHGYSTINFIQSPAFGVGNLSEPKLTSHVDRVRCVSVNQCVSAVRVLEVPAFFRLSSSCSHVTKVGGPSGLSDSY